MQKYDFFFNTIKMKFTEKVLTYHFITYQAIMHLVNKTSPT